MSLLSSNSWTVWPKIMVAMVEHLLLALIILKKWRKPWNKTIHTPQEPEKLVLAKRVSRNSVKSRLFPTNVLFQTVYLSLKLPLTKVSSLWDFPQLHPSSKCTRVVLSTLMLVEQLGTKVPLSLVMEVRTAKNTISWETPGAPYGVIKAMPRSRLLKARASVVSSS